MTDEAGAEFMAVGACGTFGGIVGDVWEMSPARRCLPSVRSHWGRRHAAVSAPLASPASLIWSASAVHHAATSSARTHGLFCSVVARAFSRRHTTRKYEHLSGDNSRAWPDSTHYKFSSSIYIPDKKWEKSFKSYLINRAIIIQWLQCMPPPS